MPEISWILIEAEKSEQNEVYRKLGKLPFIKNISAVKGDYQIVAQAVGRDFILLDRQISGKLNSIPGIRRITVLPAISEGVL
jgi:hypothetical protein